MAIEMYYVEGESIFDGEDRVYSPRLVCDACDLPILSVAEGVFVHELLSQTTRSRAGVLFAHRGACHDKLEAKLMGEGVHVGWNELAKLLFQLEHALRSRPVEAEE